VSEHESETLHTATSAGNIGRSERPRIAWQAREVGLGMHKQYRQGCYRNDGCAYVVNELGAMSDTVRHATCSVTGLSIVRVSQCSESNMTITTQKMRSLTYIN
jgi:hypothetical protein